MTRDLPNVFFHLSYSFHKWFLYYKGDFEHSRMDALREKVVRLEQIFSKYESEVLTLISKYVGLSWPFREIHVYCFEGPAYFNAPCIPDPPLINIHGENYGLLLLFLIHELVHFIMLFDSRFKDLDMEVEEAVAYFVANRVLRDITGEEAEEAIAHFTVSWPYNYSRIARKYERAINLDDNTVLDLLEHHILRR